MAYSAMVGVLGAIVAHPRAQAVGTAVIERASIAVINRVRPSAPPPPPPSPSKSSLCAYYVAMVAVAIITSHLITLGASAYYGVAPFTLSNVGSIAMMSVGGTLLTAEFILVCYLTYRKAKQPPTSP